MTTARWSTVTTPVAPFTTIVGADDAVLASGWTTDVETLATLIHPSIAPDDLSHVDDLGPITAAITAYHDGDLAAIDTIPVRQVSGEFTQQAWKTLRTVAPGRPITYSDFAERSGRPAAVRAAAAACAKNPAALFVPCHRVTRMGGHLGGFRYGLDIKRWLLRHERPHENL